ncbi:MAG: hypothetical protein P4L87_16985 [Formivibrio sp.]|nr:hypothetical protein [Formivibrio sp.]MDR3539817.1 hypothetical protein [Desulfosporosinus sp.]
MFRILFFFLLLFPISAFPAAFVGPSVIATASDGTVIVQSAPGASISNQIAQMTSPITSTADNFIVNNTANVAIDSIGTAKSSISASIKTGISVGKTAVKSGLVSALKQGKIVPAMVVSGLITQWVLDKVVSAGLQWQSDTREYLKTPLRTSDNTSYCNNNTGSGIYFCSTPSGFVSAIKANLNFYTDSCSFVVSSPISIYLTCQPYSYNYTFYVAPTQPVLTPAPATDDDFNSVVNNMVDVDYAGHEQDLIDAADAFSPMSLTYAQMSAFAVDPVIFTNAHTVWNEIKPATATSLATNTSKSETSTVKFLNPITSPAVGTASKTSLPYSVTTVTTTTTQTINSDGSLSDPVTTSTTSTDTTADSKTDTQDVPLIGPNADFPATPDYPTNFQPLPSGISGFIASVPWIPSTYSCTDPKFPFYTVSFDLPLCQWIVKFRGLFEWFWNILTAISIYLMIRSTNLSSGGMSSDV